MRTHLAHLTGNSFRKQKRGALDRRDKDEDATGQKLVLSPETSTLMPRESEPTEIPAQ